MKDIIVLLGCKGTVKGGTLKPENLRRSTIHMDYLKPYSLSLKVVCLFHSFLVLTIQNEKFQELKISIFRS